jgi:hypothetical protein
VGSVFEADKLRDHPITWANDVLTIWKNMGIDTSDPNVMARVISEVGRGNKLLKSALDESLMPNTNAQINRELANINKVGGDALGILNNKDYKAAMQEFQAQWKTFSETVGAPMVKARNSYPARSPGH